MTELLAGDTGKCMAKSLRRAESVTVGEATLYPREAVAWMRNRDREAPYDLFAEAVIY